MKNDIHNRMSTAYRQILAHYYNLLIPTSATVLEVGCADAGLLSLLNGTEKVGVDCSEEQIQ